MNDNQTTFIPDYDALGRAVAVMVEQSHGAMILAGWHTDLRTGELIPLSHESVGQKLALIHSEIAEATEGNRKGLMDDKLPHRSGVEVELSDALLRITDQIGRMGLQPEMREAMRLVLSLPRAAVAFAMALRTIGELSAELGLDLPGATAEKASFNAHRADHKIEARKAVGGKGY